MKVKPNRAFAADAASDSDAAVARLKEAVTIEDSEKRADMTGANVCAAAGDNPWQLVWLFQDFKNAQPNQLPSLYQRDFGF